MARRGHVDSCSAAAAGKFLARRNGAARPRNCAAAELYYALLICRSSFRPSDRSSDFRFFTCSFGSAGADHPNIPLNMVRRKGTHGSPMLRSCG